MNKIRGIIFDKDGTLLDFNSIWLPAAEFLAEYIAAIYGNRKLKKQLLESIGVKENEIETDGILASGTVGDMSGAFYEVLSINNILVSPSKLQEIISNMLSKFVEDNEISIVPTGKLAALFHKLKSKNIIIGLATSDSMTSTMHCLEKLGILHYFDFIRTGDVEIPAKPDPEVLHQFYKQYELKPEEVAVVGDTVVDMKFARNGKAGITIGVLSGVGTAYELSEMADFVYENVNEILNNDELFS